MERTLSIIKPDAVDKKCHWPKFILVLSRRVLKL